MTFYFFMLRERTPVHVRFYRAHKTEIVAAAGRPPGRRQPSLWGYGGISPHNHFKGFDQGINLKKMLC